ncbi:MAG: hypothetical protein K8Q97_04905 [Candidatus Andersenbacteria bacterium]|nr:hypothetical protein [Candidatus Andersenbacteria bacterium]
MSIHVKRNLPLYIALGAGGLLSVGFFSSIFLIASHEQFKVISSPTPPPASSPEISWITYSNHYFSLSYPNSAKEEILEKNANPAVVASWVAYQQSSHMQIATQVLQEPDMASIADFSAVAFRHSKSDIYAQKPITVSGIFGVEFSRHSVSDNPAEFGAFVLRNGLVYTFVVQAKDETYAEQVYRRILSTLSFVN